MLELADEVAYAVRCREVLRAMVDGARSTVLAGEHAWGDRYTAERLGYHLKSLARELADEPDSPPFFGATEYSTDASAGEHRGQRYYLGRRHISDEIGRPPLVIDWRAPVSTAFYRAGSTDSQGIAIRRRFGWSGGTLTGFEDERLDAPGTGTPSRIVTAEIERPRVGPMRDIVATIQPEQDELVRATLEESICVQGAPGTGKTAVGLHRAAYLLYAHRTRLKRSGVLVLGPNRAFLHYISAVLPTLGEIDVEQTTMDQLLSPGPARATDTASAAAIKHDGRMAVVLHRALYQRVRRAGEAIVVADGSYRWRASEQESRRIVDDARREGTAYLVGRGRVIARIVTVLRRQAEARGQICNAVWTRRVSKAVTPYVDEVWPSVTADEVVAELLGDAAVMARAAAGVLTADEQALLLWARAPRSVKSARWSTADAVLLDEVAGLLARQDGYGHVIVDEAQDLSPMQCRSIARRSELGSITVLGDLAQGTTPWAARDWPSQLRHLGKPEGRVVVLTTGYRVPAAVVALANRLLGTLGVEVPATVAFRSDGHLRMSRVADLSGGYVSAVRAALVEEGSIGVIVADHSADGVAAALAAAEIATVDAEGNGRVAVVSASLAKGLEFDHVVVVEPAEIVAAEERGLHRLYVVLTRAVSRLEVVHSRRLPRQIMT